ncbi:MAG TPA: excalibur calcium-binding domain-containing protein [Croceicoccus sp.]|nr:excalibur calcium-binding domain-containing protein [Croceicoccus sp.]
MAGRLLVGGAALLALFLGGQAARAHGGGVDAAGCHVEKRTGLRHCHGQKAAPTPQLRTSTDGNFPNCAKVRAAGRAPLRRGATGYRASLDRDGDGIACEPYR